MRKRYLVTENQNQKLINKLIEGVRLKMNLSENDNVPDGAEYDSRAPWNQSDRKYSDAEHRDISNLNVIYRYKDDLALVKSSDGVYAVDVDRAKDEGLWDFVEVPYDELDDVYDKEQAEIQNEDILSYFVDVLSNGNVGSGLDFWESGNSTVAKVDNELMQELQSIFEFNLSNLA